MINLLTLPKQCVFGFFDEEGGAFYINYTSNIGQSLARAYEDFGGSELASRLQLRILSNTSDIETLRIHCEYYRDLYRNGEWVELVAPGRKAIGYRVGIRPSPGFGGMDVGLVTARGGWNIIARLPTRKEAEEYVLWAYGTGNEYYLPVYAANSATKEFMLDKQTKKLDL